MSELSDRTDQVPPGEPAYRVSGVTASVDVEAARRVGEIVSANRRQVSDEVLLRVTDISKAFGPRTVVDGVSFNATAGKVVGLLGPNGAGKSTTMKLCAGSLSPTSGTVSICDADPAVDVVAARFHLGYVPDVGGLFPRLTGWEHVELAARLRELDPGWPDEAAKLLGLLGLAEVAGQRTSTYSHGMQRKLSMAIALIGRPKVLLLDEPFDGVDPAGNRLIRALIDRVASNGAAVVLCTHLIEVAEAICDELHVIADGVVQATGTAAELCERYDATSLEDAYLHLLGLQ